MTSFIGHKSVAIASTAVFNFQVVQLCEFVVVGGKFRSEAGRARDVDRQVMLVGTLLELLGEVTSAVPLAGRVGLLIDPAGKYARPRFVSSAKVARSVSIVSSNSSSCSKTGPKHTAGKLISGHRSGWPR